MYVQRIYIFLSIRVIIQEMDLKMKHITLDSHHQSAMCLQAFNRYSFAFANFPGRTWRMGSIK